MFKIKKLAAIAAAAVMAVSAMAVSVSADASDSGTEMYDYGYFTYGAYINTYPTGDKVLATDTYTQNVSVDYLSAGFSGYDSNGSFIPYGENSVSNNFFVSYSLRTTNTKLRATINTTNILRNNGQVWRRTLTVSDMYAN